MLQRVMRASATLVLLVAVAAGAQFLYLLWRIDRTGRNDLAQPADVIVVLGARVEADGKPGPDLTSRTLHAVDLFADGLAPVLICSGGYQGDRMSAAAVCRRLAVAQGVPSTSVLLAEGSMTTSEDAVSVASLMASKGWRTAILVSHPLHLARAQIVFERQGVSTYPSPTSTELSAIPARTRAWLTLREAAGIVWYALAQLGVPYDWTSPLSRWFYG